MAIFRIFIGISAVGTGVTVLLETPTTSNVDSVTEVRESTEKIVETAGLEESQAEASTPDNEGLKASCNHWSEAPLEVPVAPPLFESALPIDPGHFPKDCELAHRILS